MCVYVKIQSNWIFKYILSDFLLSFWNDFIYENWINKSTFFIESWGMYC